MREREHIIRPWPRPSSWDSDWGEGGCIAGRGFSNFLRRLLASSHLDDGTTMEETIWILQKWQEARQEAMQWSLSTCTAENNYKQYGIRLSLPGGEICIEKIKQDTNPQSGSQPNYAHINTLSVFNVQSRGRSRKGMLHPIREERDKQHLRSGFLAIYEYSRRRPNITLLLISRENRQ